MPSIEMLTRAGLMTTVAIVVGFSVLVPLLKKPAPDTVRIATMASAAPVVSDGVGSEPASVRAISLIMTAASPVPGNGSEPVAVRATSYLTIDEPTPAVRDTRLPPANELAPTDPAQSLAPATPLTEDALAPSRQGAVSGEQSPPSQANTTGGAQKVPAPPGGSAHIRKPKQVRVRSVPFSYSQSLGAH